MMQTQHAAWLRQLAVDGFSGQTLPSIPRGDAHSFAIKSSIDFSGDAFKMQLRLGPDAEGAALASFAVDVGAYAGGEMTISFDLTEAQTLALPSDGNADGLTELTWEIERDVSSTGKFRRFAAGNIFVSGKVAA